MKKGDWIVLGVLLAAALCALGGRALISSKAGEEVVIRVNGEVFEQLPLHEERVISVNGHNTVTVSDGCVWVSEADCPDQICVQQGKAEKPGKTIVCLPNRMTVEIEGEE